MTSFMATTQRMRMMKMMTKMMRVLRACSRLSLIDRDAEPGGDGEADGEHAGSSAGPGQ